MKNFGLLLVLLCVHFGESWNVNLQILLEEQDGCPETVSCRTNMQLNGFLNVSLHTVPPGDLFAKARAVHSVPSDVVIDSACSSCRTTYLDQPRIWNSKDGSCCLHKCPLMSGRTLYVHDVQTVQSVNNEEMNKPDISNDTFLSIMSFILKQERSSTYIVIMTSLDGYSELVPVFSTNMTLTLSYVVDINGSFASEQELKDIYGTIEEEDLNFIAICSASCIRNIITQVQNLEKEVQRSTTFKQSRWLLVPTDDSMEAQKNVFTNMPITESADISVVNFESCQQQRSILNVEEIVDSISTTTTIKSKLKAVDLTYQAVENLISNPPPAIADVYTVYGTDKGQTLRLNGRVASDESSVLDNELFNNDKYGYNNRTFIVGMLPWPPFVYKEVDGGKIKYTGLSVDLLEELAQRLNFSYIYRESEDQEWGRVLNGKWTGLVGEIAEGKLDLVVTPLTISDARESQMDFTQPYFYVHSMVILAKQDPNANKWLTLVSPFRYEVHICILISLILSTVFLFTVEEINPVNKWTDNRLSARRTRYGDILWYHFGALMANGFLSVPSRFLTAVYLPDTDQKLCQGWISFWFVSGGAYLPNTQSGRSVLACWWLLTVIMAATYSGNLIAFLTVNRETPPFSTLSEMVQQKDYTWGVLGGSAIITLFESSKRADYQQIWNGIERDTKLDPDVQSKDLDVHLRKVLSERYAYIGDSTTWEVWQTQSCNLDVLDEQFYPMTYGIGLPNNSVHTKVFSDQLLRIQESGLVEVWHQRWKPAVRCEKSSTGAKRVDILALQSAFYAAGVGVLLALLILSTEYVYNKTCKGKLTIKCCGAKVD